MIEKERPENRPEGIQGRGWRFRGPCEYRRWLRSCFRGESPESPRLFPNQIPGLGWKHEHRTRPGPSACRTEQQMTLWAEVYPTPPCSVSHESSLGWCKAPEMSFGLQNISRETHMSPYDPMSVWPKTNDGPKLGLYISWVEPSSIHTRVCWTGLGSNYNVLVSTLNIMKYK